MGGFFLFRCLPPRFCTPRRTKLLLWPLIPSFLSSRNTANPPVSTWSCEISLWRAVFCPSSPNSWRVPCSGCELHSLGTEVRQPQGPCFGQDSRRGHYSLPFERQVAHPQGRWHRQPWRSLLRRPLLGSSSRCST